MPSSRAERARRLTRAAVPAALLLTLALPAAAEVGKPVRLLPAPPPAAAPPAPGAAEPAAPRPAAPAATDDIRAAPLAPVDGAWAGGLRDGDGGFPATMWRGTPRAAVAAALPLLSPSNSPVLQGLARRLLLSDAVAPAGTDAAERPPLAALRLERLVALGEAQGALAVIDQLPKGAQGEATDRAQVELRFAANDPDAGCRTAQERIARYQNPWWDRALVACEALAGEQEKAALGLGLLREQKAPRDATFDMLVETLSGQRRKMDKLPDPSPIKLALLAAAKQPLPAEALDNADPLLLREWAGNEAVPASLRLGAAERAAALGALPPAALATLYEKIDFKPEEEAALKDGRPPDDARGRALLYVAARKGGPVSRAAALAALLADGRARGAFIVTARMLAPLLAELPPTKEPDGFAADAARALLAAGRPDAAAPWLAASDAKELLVVKRLAGPAAEGDATALLRDGVAALAARDSAAAPRQAELLAALLAALDEPVAGLNGSPLLAPPHEAVLPSALLWVEQQQASAQKRLGQTVLTTVLIATAEEHLAAEPIVLGRAVAGLKAVGLEAEARGLAVEAALDAGI